MVCREKPRPSFSSENFFEGKNTCMQLMKQCVTLTVANSSERNFSVASAISGDFSPHPNLASQGNKFLVVCSAGWTSTLFFENIQNVVGCKETKTPVSKWSRLGGWGEKGNCTHANGHHPGGKMRPAMPKNGSETRDPSHMQTRQFATTSREGCVDIFSLSEVCAPEFQYSVVCQSACAKSAFL